MKNVVENQAEVSNEHASSFPDIVASKPMVMPYTEMKEHHYNQFFVALRLLKSSIEELWCLELRQLDPNQKETRGISKPPINIEIPSIYSCRNILPLMSETNCVEVKSSITMKTPSPSCSSMRYESVNSIRPNENIIKQKTSRFPHHSSLGKEKIRLSRFDTSKKRKKLESNDKFNKNCKEKALLHLNFRCARHMV